MARALADPLRERTRGSGWLLLMLGASLVRALGILCLPGVCGRALDLLLTPGADATGQSAWVGASIGLLIAVPLCEAVTMTAAGALVAANTARGRRRLVDHILAVGPRLLGGAGVGDLVARVVGNTAQAATVSSRIAVVGISALPVLGAIALMFAIDVGCAAVFSAGLAILVLLSRSVLRNAREVNTQYLQTQGRIATAVIETLAARAPWLLRGPPRSNARGFSPLSRSCTLPAGDSGTSRPGRRPEGRSCCPRCRFWCSESPVAGCPRDN